MVSPTRNFMDRINIFGQVLIMSIMVCSVLGKSMLNWLLNPLARSTPLTLPMKYEKGITPSHGKNYKML